MFYKTHITSLYYYMYIKSLNFKMPKMPGLCGILCIFQVFLLGAPTSQRCQGHENRKRTGCKLAFSVIPLMASSWHGVGFIVNRANNDVI